MCLVNKIYFGCWSDLNVDVVTEYWLVIEAMGILQCGFLGLGPLFNKAFDAVVV